MRYTGYCEKIAENLNVSPLLDWITSIPFKEWPQQHRLFGELRPAMINDQTWHGFGERAISFVSSNFSFVSWRNPMLSVVMPGHFIHSHIDTQPVDWLHRIHVPLTTNRECCTFMDRAYHMEVGSAYKLNTERRHAVLNHGGTPRIHFMFDVSHSA